MGVFVHLLLLVPERQVSVGADANLRLHLPVEREGERQDPHRQSTRQYSGSLVPTSLISNQSNSGPPHGCCRSRCTRTGRVRLAPAPCIPLWASEADSRPYTGSEAAYSIHSGLPAKLGATDMEVHRCHAGVAHCQDSLLFFSDLDDLIELLRFNPKHRQPLDCNCQLGNRLDFVLVNCVEDASYTPTSV
jgi:hypothetical protein